MFNTALKLPSSHAATVEALKIIPIYGTLVEFYKVKQNLDELFLAPVLERFTSLLGNGVKWSVVTSA